MAVTFREKCRTRATEAASGGRERTPDAEELYRFIDRLYRAGTQNDVYEAALDTISRALGCSRASILLFDGTGIMRFAAWRGLSDGYRRAVEGHSPWTRDVDHADVQSRAGRTSAPRLSRLRSSSGGVLGVGGARIGKHLWRRTCYGRSIDCAGHRIMCKS
jgi:hypothetical protein